MTAEELERWRHDHAFVVRSIEPSERRARAVVVLTAAMMVLEIAAGKAFGSMALLADGWHMATHAVALGIAAYAYAYARKHAHDRRYSFGTGKVSALGGFASAAGLAVVATGVLVESAVRLGAPVPIRFDEALVVTGVGLAVNLACAWILGRPGHAHDAHGAHVHAHDHAEHRDHNLRGAYLHVLADALTSVFALAALAGGKFLGWTRLDPLVGMIGAVLIGRWALGLLRDTQAVLLDAEVSEERLQAIRSAIESDGTSHIADLHVWRVGPRHYAAILSIVTPDPRAPEHYKQLLAHQPDLAHVTIEVNPSSS